MCLSDLCVRKREITMQRTKHSADRAKRGGVQTAKRDF